MTKLLLFFVVIFATLLISLFFALPVMWLWNGLMPAIFKLPEITFLQALGLNILCGILFKPNYNTQSKK